MNQNRHSARRFRPQPIAQRPTPTPIAERSRPRFDSKDPGALNTAQGGGFGGRRLARH